MNHSKPNMFLSSYFSSKLPTNDSTTPTFYHKERELKPAFYPLLPETVQQLKAQGWSDEHIQAVADRKASRERR